MIVAWASKVGHFSAVWATVFTSSGRAGVTADRATSAQVTIRVLQAATRAVPATAATAIVLAIAVPATQAATAATRVEMAETVAVTELTVYAQILAFLQAQEVPFTIHEHDESRTFNDAKEALPFPLERLLKTVAFRLKTGGWILVALRGQDRIDYKRLARVLGVKRNEIVQLSPDEVKSVLHVESGSVAPVPTVPKSTWIFGRVESGQNSADD